MKTDHLIRETLEVIQEGGETAAELLAQSNASLPGEVRSTLETVAWLQERQPALNPRPGYVAASRLHLAARLRASTQQPARPDHLPFGWLKRSWSARSYRQRIAVRLVLAVLLVVAMLANTSSIALAARISFPGDTFYPVKILKEEIQLALSLTPQADARLRTQFAQRRLAEMAALILEGRYEYLDSTSAQFEDQVTRAVELVDQIAARQPEQAAALAAGLENSVLKQVDVIAYLGSAVPPWAGFDVGRVVRVMEQAYIDLQVGL